MSARSVITRRSGSHSDHPEKPTFAEVLSESPDDADGEPYICRFPDTEDSDVGETYLRTGQLLIKALPWPADFF